MGPSSSPVHRLALATAAGSGVLMLLTACGGVDDTATGPTGATTAAPATSAPQQSATFNDADVTFAQNMIPHHQQAVEMAEMAESRASDPEVKELAAKIKSAQDPEITTLTTWLAQWGKPVTPEAGHGGHDMSGMMDEEDMNKLMAAKGTGFDRMFCETMIDHHEGAIEMAKTEQAQGANPDAKEMAKTIETAQQAEIEQMNEILARL